MLRIYTLYNIAARKRPDFSQWWSHRLDVFGNYCLPSMVAQTTKDFNWTLMIDPDTTKDEYKQLLELTIKHHWITLKRFRNASFKICALEDDNTRPTFTMRMDSDNCLYPTLLEEMIATIDHTSNHRQFINPYRGYFYNQNNKTLLAANYGPSIGTATIALFEPEGFDPITIGHTQHGNWHKIMDKYDIVLRPIGLSRWVYMVHDFNKCTPQTTGIHKRPKDWPFPW